MSYIKTRLLYQVKGQVSLKKKVKLCGIQINVWWSEPLYKALAKDIVTDTTTLNSERKHSS